MNSGTISMSKVKDVLNYTIDNNIKLQENGKTPIAIGIEGEAGIGKTSIVRQVAEERGMKCTTLCLHEMEEVGDLLGFPQIEYECQLAKVVKDKDGAEKKVILPGTVWLSGKQYDSMDKRFVRQTGKSRTSYAKPAWVPEYNENGNIVILDDYVRCNQQLLQATMAIMLEQQYTSWKLPKKTTIVATNNPDNGQYNVNSLDDAQKSRFLNFEIEFDIDAFCQWAEKNNIDSRCITFVANYYSELFNANENGERICNPRSFVMFANMISGISDWDKPENLEFITMISNGCFKDEGAKFSKMFAAFIRNKMHLLIQPKDILLGGWDTIKQKLEETLYDSNGEYRADIASILERRFSNYVVSWLESDDKTPVNKVIKRILDFMDNKANGGKEIFYPELLYHMLKRITSTNKKQTNKLLTEIRIAKILANE